MGRSFWSRWQVAAYASVEPEHDAVLTMDTNSTKSESATPAPAAAVEHSGEAVQPAELGQVHVCRLSSKLVGTV